MKVNNSSIPSIKKDIFYSLIITTAIVAIFYTVYLLFGNSKEFSAQITYLFGAILAFSGLMTKQYLLKENIKYLGKWKLIEQLIDDISINSSKMDIEESNLSQQLAEKNNKAFSYMNYMIFEIKIIPIIPLLLVVLYGSALIATEPAYISTICLTFMLFLVSYLAQATITSNNLVIDSSELDSTIKELEDVAKILNELQNKEQS